MSAHSRMAAVNVAVDANASPENYWSWLQHVALALNAIVAWANQPRLIPQTVATLPAPAIIGGTWTDATRKEIALAGMLAMVTDGASGGGIVSGGGTRIQLVFFNGTDWKVVAE